MVMNWITSGSQHGKLRNLEKWANFPHLLVHSNNVFPVIVLDPACRTNSIHPPNLTCPLTRHHFKKTHTRRFPHAWGAKLVSFAEESMPFAIIYGFELSPSFTYQLSASQLSPIICAAQVTRSPDQSPCEPRRLQGLQVQPRSADPLPDPLASNWWGCIYCMLESCWFFDDLSRDSRLVDFFVGGCDSYKLIFWGRCKVLLPGSSFWYYCRLRFTV